MSDLDYYEVLGARAHVHRRRDQEGVPAARAPVPPRREPRRSAGGRALQGSQRRVRDAARSRTPAPLRHVRHRRRPRAAPAPAFGAGAFGLNDLFDAFFGGDAFGRRRAARADRRAGPDAEIAIELTLAEVVFGVAQDASSRACRSSATPAAAPVRRAGHAPGTLHDVRGHGRGAPGAALAARPARDRGAVPGVRRARARSCPTRARPAAATGACTARARSTSRCRPASTTASGCGSRSAARRRRAAACRATST